MTTETLTPQAWLSQEETRRYAARWEEIQAGFVRDPRTTLEQADALVADVLDRMTAMHAEERRALHGRWEPAETPTESLRTALQSYRGMFEALLA